MEDRDKSIASYEARIKDLESEKAALKAAAETGDKVLPVEGSFTAIVTEKGENKKVKYGFKDGFNFVRNHEAVIFPSGEVIKLANTGKIDEATVQLYPALKSLTQDTAKALLQGLVDLGYAGLKTI